MVTSRTSPPSRFTKQELDVHKRDWCNDHLLMWHLCANTACRRARCCRGDPTACFDANFRQLPEGVQDWFALLAKFNGDHVPFDAAWAELTRLGLVDDLCNWQALVRGKRSASGAAN
jgi:hypothetical protein